MKWSITEVYATEGVITRAKYHVMATKGDDSVETEGYWDFSGDAKIPFESVTEEMIVGWIETTSMRDGKCVIKSRLQEQLDANQKPVVAPWMPQVFTLG